MTRELDITVLVAQALDVVQVPYVVGGSFASTIHGEARATRDVDIVLALRPPQVDPLVTLLADQFYIDRNDLWDATQRAPTLHTRPTEHATANLLHQPSFFKVDLFISSSHPFTLQQLSRAVTLTVNDYPLRIMSAEDTILAKLAWYRLGNEVSERQWRDVLAMVAVQGETLDVGYLAVWAATLGVHDLWKRAQRRTAPDDPPDTATQLPLV